MFFFLCLRLILRVNVVKLEPLTQKKSVLSCFLLRAIFRIITEKRTAKRYTKAKFDFELEQRTIFVGLGFEAMAYQTNKIKKQIKTTRQD